MNNNLLKFFLVFLISLGLIACAGQEVKEEGTGQSQDAVSTNADTGDSDASASNLKSEEELKAEKMAEEEERKKQRERIKNWTADELMLTKVYYKYNDDTVNADGLDTIDLHVKFMQEYPEVVLQLHGNTDERGTQEYNLALGDRRGASVSKVLIDKGINPDRIIVVSYGESRPVDKASTPEAWAKNRRVDFLYE